MTGSDNADDCAALLAAYAAWGNQPESWAAGIAAGSSYCAWDTNSIQMCYNDGRVTRLCAARYPKNDVRRGAGRVDALCVRGGLSGCARAPAHSNLNSNQLSGTIPATLGSLASLNTLCAAPPALS